MDIVVHRCTVKLVDNVSATSDYQTEAFNIQNFSLFCIQVEWDNVTYAGTLPLVDIFGSNTLDGRYVSLRAATVINGTNATLINIEKAGYGFIKIVYKANGALTGTFSANINAKVV